MTSSTHGRAGVARAFAVTDFDGAGGDAILLSGFARTEVEVRADGGDTGIVLPDPAGRITLRGVARLDDDDLTFR